MSHSNLIYKPQFTTETSICEKCILENNKEGNIARGSIRQYCPGYTIWNINGILVL